MSQVKTVLEKLEHFFVMMIMMMMILVTMICVNLLRFVID